MPETSIQSSYEAIYVKSGFIKATRNKYNILPMWERWHLGASERVPCVARGEVVDDPTELEELTNWLLQSTKAGSEIRPAVTSHISNTLQRSPSGPDTEKLPSPRLTDTAPEHIQNEDLHITGWLRKTLLCNRHSR